MTCCWKWYQKAKLFFPATRPYEQITPQSSKCFYFPMMTPDTHSHHTTWSFFSDTAVKSAQGVTTGHVAILNYCCSLKFMSDATTVLDTFIPYPGTWSMQWFKQSLFTGSWQPGVLAWCQHSPLLPLSPTQSNLQIQLKKKLFFTSFPCPVLINPLHSEEGYTAMMDEVIFSCIKWLIVQRKYSEKVKVKVTTWHR